MEGANGNEQGQYPTRWDVKSIANWLVIYRTGNSVEEKNGIAFQGLGCRV